MPPLQPGNSSDRYVDKTPQSLSKVIDTVNTPSSIPTLSIRKDLSLLQIEQVVSDRLAHLDEQSGDFQLNLGVQLKAQKIIDTSLARIAFSVSDEDITA